MQEISEMWVRSLDQEDSLEEGMATHSSILAWRIPWTEEPGGLQSMRMPRVGHDWVHTYTKSDKELPRTSLVVQRLRICLPMQGPWVQSLIQEDATCLRAPKPLHHNYWSLCALEPVCARRQATVMRSPQTAISEEPPLATLENVYEQQWRPRVAKNK